MVSAIKVFLTSKIAGPIFAGTTVALALALAVIWGVYSWRVSDLQSEKAALTESINDPETGYVVRLSTCRGNLVSLEGSLKTQSEAVAGLVEAGRLATENAERALVAARTVMAQANRGAAQLLARQPVGDECTAALNLLREASQ